MALILNIETATNVCSVALALDGKILSLRENNEGQSHARVLTTLISETLSESGKAITSLDAVCVSKGPGSFTGLRIGVSSAKGICYALGIPLISVNTLQSMATCFIQKYPEFSEHLLCPMIDARRMEVYTAIFDSKLNVFKETAAEIVEEGSFRELTESHKVVFFGDGMQKTIHLIGNHKNSAFIDHFEPSASGMTGFSENSYQKEEFESTVYFEPFYLKDFYSPRQPS